MASPVPQDKTLSSDTPIAPLDLYSLVQQRLATPGELAKESRFGLELLRAQLEIEMGLLTLAERRLEGSWGGPTIRQLREMSWLLLARSRLERGELAAAEALLDRVGGTLPPPLESERLHLLAILAQQRGATHQAIAIYQSLQSLPQPPLLATLNYATLLLRQGRTEHGLDLLYGVSTAEGEEGDVAALKDRAALLLGDYFLGIDAYDEAAKWLQQVRLQGPYTNQALLLLGWVELERQGPEQALVPWFELRARGESHEAEEAMLAIAQAIERKGAAKRVIRHYRELIAELERRHVLLLAERGRVETGDAVIGSLYLQSGPATHTVQRLEVWRNQIASGAIRYEPAGEGLAPIWAQLEKSYPAAEGGAGTGIASAVIHRTAAFLHQGIEGQPQRHPWPGEAVEGARETLLQAIDDELVQCRQWQREERRAAIGARLARIEGYRQQALLAIARTHELALARQEQGR